MSCIFFHRWSKWTAYDDTGYRIYTGLLIDAEIKGKPFPYIDKKQRRICNDCGKIQDELI